MINKARVALPEHFEHEYPRFVSFLEAYFEWKDRDTAFGHDEMELAISEGVKSPTPSPGHVSSNVAQDHQLERSFQLLVTSDNKIIESSDGRVMHLTEVDEHHQAEWYKDSGFPQPQVSPLAGAVDKVTFLRLIRDIGRIRGTTHATKLFFLIYFGEAVDVEYPREHIAHIDNNFVLDSKKSVLRDDYYYNEFTYVVRVKEDPSFYASLFNTIYQEFFHASGFLPILKKR